MKNKAESFNCYYCDEILLLVRKLRHKENHLYLFFCYNCNDYYVYTSEK